MDRLLTRFAVAIGIVLVAAIFLMSATVCLCAALYLVLQPYMVPAAAAALTGLGALIATALALLAGRGVLQGRANPAGGALPLASSGSHPDAQAQMAQALSALVGDELSKALHQHPKSSAAIALAAGLALGASPGLRDLLLGLLKSRHV